MSTDAHKMVKDFEWHKPQVLVLAFNALEKAECYVRELQDTSTQLPLRQYRSVILCNQNEVEQVCCMCQQKYFDDYVLFWPKIHDAQRLAMAVHGVLLEHSLFNSSEPSATDFAVHTRSLAKLETVLSHQIKQSAQQIALVLRAMHQVKQEIDSAQKAGRFAIDEVGQQFRTMEESVQQLSKWVKELKEECTPHFESVRALSTLAERARMTILVADDDEFQHEFINELLPEKSYRKVFARSGVEALNIVNNIRPDLILIDIIMSDMDGIETTRRIKRIPQLANVPVIMMTGKSAQDAVKESIEAGAVNFIVKPFDRKTLLAKIASAMRSQH